MEAMLIDKSCELHSQLLSLEPHSASNGSAKHLPGIFRFYIFFTQQEFFLTAS